MYLIIFKFKNLLPTTIKKEAKASFFIIQVRRLLLFFSGP